MMQQPIQINLQDHEDCSNYVWKWQAYFAALPSQLAILPVTTEKDYWDSVGPKTRNMVRKAIERGYICEQFNYNKHLDEMYDVNTSAPVRQGQPMTRSYFEQLAPLAKELTPCNKHEQIYVGIFNKDDLLVAYCWLAVCGEVAVINRILGHADYLKDGIMNLLVAGLVRRCINRDVSWLNYRTMESATEGLTAFKKHVGFKSREVQIV